MKEIERLKKLQVEKNISNKKLAFDIGITIMTLWRWMHSESIPSLMGMDRLREYLSKHSDK